MKKKAFWDKKNPNKKSTPLTPAQKTKAKAMAKKAGRPYPNLIDNARAKKNISSPMNLVPLPISIKN